MIYLSLILKDKLKFLIPAVRDYILLSHLLSVCGLKIRFIVSWICKFREAHIPMVLHKRAAVKKGPIGRVVEKVFPLLPIHFLIFPDLYFQIGVYQHLSMVIPKAKLSSYVFYCLYVVKK